ncbi:MAG: PTS mannose/fructose/sorbose/N-acetylgalactosamine transporter subunit IIC [Bacillota bacterium]
MEFSFWQALAVGLWAAFCIIDLKSLKIVMATRPLIAAFGAGLILGDVKLGLQVGALVELMAMGVWNYGGAPIPDYAVGSILGVAFGIASGQGFEASLALAIPLALVLTYFDVLAMTVNTFIQHRSDPLAADGDANGLDRLHNWGFLVWGLSRFIPAFLGVWFGPSIANVVLGFMPEWLMGGIKVAGGLFPALGIAMLLRMLPTKRFFGFLLIGFVLAAYFKVSIIGSALVGLGLALVVRYIGAREQRADDLAA